MLFFVVIANIFNAPSYEARRQSKKCNAFRSVLEYNNSGGEQNMNNVCFCCQTVARRTSLEKILKVLSSSLSLSLVTRFVYFIIWGVKIYESNFDHKLAFHKIFLLAVKSAFNFFWGFVIGLLQKASFPAETYFSISLNHFNWLRNRFPYNWNEWEAWFIEDLSTFFLLNLFPPI